MKTINGSDIIILDGGLGTVLEDTYEQNISHTPLWSAKPIQERPELIVDAHLAFLNAGAEIISTSTYQCSRETFEQAGYTPEEAVQIMQRSVKLADDARKIYLTSQGEEGRGEKRSEAFVALSLGPFGSVVQPPQDFDGFYPPPFGPKAPSPDGTSNTRLFSPNDPSAPNTKAQEEKAIEALAEFHLWRLRALHSNPETWTAIDFVAFETVPHMRELRAIKLAMKRFEGEIRSSSSGGLERSLKGWWVSLVFPNGPESVQWGQEEREHHTRSLLGLSSLPSGEAEILNVLLDETLGAVPTGLGLNCTRIDHYPSILSSLSSKFTPQKGTPKTPIPLTLVVYPNGGRLGDTFDGVAHRWANNGNLRPDGRTITWEEEVVEIVQKYRTDWKDVIVGGCCRVYPPQIKTLREKVNQVL